jgi:adenosine deaminase
MMPLETFIRHVPKAELHIHIEGSLEPDLMFKLAARNGVALPYGSSEEVRRAYRFDDLQSFLQLYYRGMGVLIQEQDFFELTRAYLDKAHSQNVRHAEIFFDPQSHKMRGVPFETVITGIHRAMEDGVRRLGISTKLIMCFLRDFSAAEAMATLEEALGFREWIAAVGLDSAELGHPPKKFRSVFEKALREGFLTVAHAGEEGPPEYIRQAIDVLHVSRIDHGVRCVEDAGLVERLVKNKIPLTVCPLSNVKLRVFDSMAEHNLRQMLDLGLRVTVNSDDPAYFGGYVTENLLAVQEALNLGNRRIVRLVRNAFEASFLDEGEKQRFIDELDTFLSK